jgi:predicted Zn-dependent protease
MERELQQYIRRPMLQSLRFVIDDLPTEPVTSPRSVPDDEITAALGDLMLHTPHGEASARQYFSAALAQNGSNAAAKACLASLMEKEGNAGEANRLYAEAVSGSLTDDDRFWPALRRARLMSRPRKAAGVEERKRSEREALASELKRRHDDEIEKYNGAVERANGGEYAAALTMLDQLIAEAEGETVLNAAKELRRVIEKAQKKP